MGLFGEIVHTKKKTPVIVHINAFSLYRLADKRSHEENDVLYFALHSVVKLYMYVPSYCEPICTVQCFEVVNEVS
jgi:hypothetical protein